MACLASDGLTPANTCSICGVLRLSSSPNHFFSLANLDQAAHYARMNIEVAERSGHPIGLCRALIHPMRLYFWVDDLEQVERGLSTLEHTAESHSLAPLRAVALGLRGRYLIRAGRMADGVQHLKESLERLAVHRYEILKGDLISELAVALAKQNARSEALALVDQWIVAAGNANKPLHLPFLAKGSALASGDLSESLPAEECFAKAMMQARQNRRCRSNCVLDWSSHVSGSGAASCSEPMI